MKIVKTTEGTTTLLVPSVSLERAEPPTTPAFFNPAAAMNRDISVAMTEAASGSTFCDALAGVGARGIRVAKEVGREMHITMVDFNGPSLRLAERSALLNGVKRRCRIVNSETNSFLHSRFRRDEKFDFVDVDPFGTPVPYLQAALNAVADGGMLAVTATDTAVLCGVYPRVAMRRYWASTLNNSFHHETGVRILLGWCRRVAGALDLGVTPLLAYVTRHYIRGYLAVHVGATKADASMKSEGYVMECTGCRHVFSRKEPAASCEKCGKKTRVAGPLWAGQLVDEELATKAMAVCERLGFSSAGKTISSLMEIDSFPPYSFSLEEICSKLKVASLSLDRVKELLEEKGFRCHSQPFEKTGLKTDAAYSEVESAVRHG